MPEVIKIPLLLIMVTCMLGVLMIKIYRFFIWCKGRYLERKIYNKSDKRTFDCSEVVWFNKHKFYVKSWSRWSHTLDIDLTLVPIDYPVTFLRFKVDSREVKKVVRMYAELGEEI